MIDIRTLMLCFFLSALVGTFVIFLLWHQNRQRFRGIFFWVLDYGFLSIGLSLITLRELVPDWASIVFSNTLLTTGIFLGYVGTAKLLNKKPKVLINIVLIILYAIAMFYYSVIEDSLAIRTMFLGLVSMIIFAENAWILLFKVPEDKKRLTLFPGLLLGFYSIVNLARAIQAIIIPHGTNDFLHTNDIDKVVLVVSILLLITLTFSLALMFNGFLNVDLAKKREKLAELNATKDKLFSVIAHDLKSPFNTILGFTEILKENFAKKDEAESLRYAGIVHDSSKRAMDLLQNLLEWSQSQTGRLTINFTNLHIRDLVEQVFVLLKDTAEHKKISLINEIPQHAVVKADHDMTSTVFRNLLSNAIKFSHQGKQVYFSARQTQTYWEISVTDQGTGIDPEALDKLFRIDRNCTKPGTENEKGTGLGLLLCHEFAEKQGGELTVFSKLGEGSTFILSLPKAEPSA
jgi:signal transduction histidine kinase